MDDVGFLTEGQLVSLGVGWGTVFVSICTYLIVDFIKELRKRKRRRK